MKSLKDYRKLRNMTQPQLAKALGVSLRYIAFLESNERTPSMKTASKICEVLDIDKRNIFLIFKSTESTKSKVNKY